VLLEMVPYLRCVAVASSHSCSLCCKYGQCVSRGRASVSISSSAYRRHLRVSRVRGSRFQFVLSHIIGDGRVLRCLSTAVGLSCFSLPFSPLMFF
jgi:hypothetical protein